ncbi:MAG: fibronectin type III domain-containing protein [Chloroflexia bacterium]
MCGDVILGKPDFCDIAPGTTTANKLFWPHGVVIDRTSTPNRLYVYDAGNNRILGFNLSGCLSSATNPLNCSADIVIGQPSFFTSACNGDSGYQAYPSRAPASADSLCGQPENTLSVTESGSGASMAVDNQGNLYVTDFFNHRVLKYISPFTTDSIADDVWGQSDFTGNTCNRGLAAPNATTLCFGWGDSNNWTAGVEIDSAGNLWVTDSGNNRVLRFPAGSHQANLVIGQQNFTGRTPGSALNMLNAPAVVRVNSGGRVYVADQGNSRVLVFDPPFINGMSGSVFGSGFAAPSGIDFDPVQGGVWIMSRDCNSLERWDESAQTLIERIGGIGNLLDRTTGSIGIDSAGNRYIAIGVGDYQNDVLMFAPGGSPTAPTKQLFGAGIGNDRTATGLASGGGVAVANNQLIVADNGRIIFWNNPSTLASGQAADGVAGVGSVGTFANALRDCCLTLKADRNNHLWVSAGMAGDFHDRIDVYALPLVNGAQPIASIQLPLPVLGGGQLAATGNFQQFWGLAPSPMGDFLWLSHTATNRVFRVRNPLTNPVVDVVLGQTDLSGTLCNRGGQPRTGATPDSLCLPGSLSLDQLGNLYVSDHSLEIQGNMRLLEFNTSLFPTGNSQVIYAPPASKIFPDVATWEPAFDAQNRMVVGYNPYWDFNPGDRGRFPGVYNNPLSASTTPDALLSDYYSMAISAAFDDEGNLYVGDGDRSRVIIYKQPFATLPSPTSTNTSIPTITPTAMSTASATASPTRTSSPVPTSTPTQSPTRTSTRTNTSIPSFTGTATRAASPTASPTRTSSPVSTSTRTQSPTRTSTATPTPTATGTLIFSNVQETNITTSQATIQWTTSGPGTSSVAYGTNMDSLSLLSAMDPTLTISHTVTLTGLVANTKYYYTARSTSGSGIQCASIVYRFMTRNR